MTTGATFSFITFTLSQVAKYAGTKVAIPRFDVFDQADCSDKPFTENREVAFRFLNMPKFNVGGGFCFVFGDLFKVPSGELGIGFANRSTLCRALHEVKKALAAIIGGE